MRSAAFISSTLSWGMAQILSLIVPATLLPFSLLQAYFLQFEIIVALVPVPRAALALASATLMEDFF